MRVTINTQMDINLLNTPFKQWPKQAQDLAMYIISFKTNRRKLENELPELRKAWLVAKVEKLNSKLLSIDDV